ncbi:MAG: hypothetical protein J5930_12030 [Treponema sp.]|nr:hypothetical protein [Treponema sp.]
MSIFQMYLILFIGSSYVGVCFLSWLQVCYLHGRAYDYLNGLKITLTVTTVLVAAILAIVHVVVRPSQEICDKCKRGNYKPSEDEKNTVLSMMKKLHIVTLIATVVGFLFGNLISMSISIARGAIPADSVRIAIVVAQSISTGAAATLYTMHAMETLLASHLAVLHINRIDSNMRYGKIAGQIAFMAVTSIFYCAINVGVVPYQMVIAGAGGNNYINYVTHTITVLLGSLAYCIPPLSIVLYGIYKRIKENSRQLTQLSDEGNLTSRLDISQIDDLGWMTGSINIMMDQVANTVSAFKVEADTVAQSAEMLDTLSQSSSAAIEQMGASFGRIENESARQENLIHSVNDNMNELHDSANNLEQYIYNQGSAVRKNSRAIARMVSSITDMADMTQKAAVLSQTLSGTSARGNELIQQAVDSINKIHEASTEVQSIVKVIQSIASQTNLLSMNAAIEAAHAGAYGAGFAVVADEVRSLASSSSASTSDIQKRIKDMASKINGGVQSITEAGVAFRQIAECVEENQKLVDTISQSMNEQKNDAEETMSVTNSVTDALEKTNLLVHEQTEYVNNIKTAMDEVVSSSKQVSAVITDGKEATTNLLGAMEQVVQNVSSNKASVSRMNQEINSFAL